MRISLFVPAILLGAWAAAAGQLAAAQTQAGTAPQPRVCVVDGKGGSVHGAPAWSIAVSSEGPGCTHARHFRSRASGYDIVVSPQHGQIAQSSAGEVTYVTYTPEKGYAGGDAFTLRSQSRSVDLPYVVTIVR